MTLWLAARVKSDNCARILSAMSSSTTAAFRNARDFLLKHREDYATAYAGFEWPKLERFNWALDWFDQIAAGERGAQTALWVVYEDGREDKLTFAELSERSNRIANYYRSLGVKRGDRVLLMLGNIPPLWETMLAMMKLGARDRAHLVVFAYEAGLVRPGWAS